jgi:hypothetical protein
MHTSDPKVPAASETDRCSIGGGASQRPLVVNVVIDLWVIERGFSPRSGFAVNQNRCRSERGLKPTTTCLTLLFS